MWSEPSTCLINLFEYMIDGTYSTKSDVFSFGVLILEIVSGKRNTRFFNEDNLLSLAWRQFIEGKCSEIIDATISDSFNLSAVLRSIHVALLCVHISPDDRPSMSSVVLMLSSESTLPQPKLPGFLTNTNQCLKTLWLDLPSSPASSPSIAPSFCFRRSVTEPSMLFQFSAHRSIYNYQIDIVGYPQYVMREGAAKTFRMGSWNGIEFSGAPKLKQNGVYKNIFVSNEEELYYSYELFDKSVAHRMVLTTDGHCQRIYWNKEENLWSGFSRFPADDCDFYDKCGAYASCNINKYSLCSCLDGFVPKTADIYGGCMRRTPLSCPGDGRQKTLQKGKVTGDLERDAKAINEHENEDVELTLFELPTIISATKNFSTDNKLGEGGFGSVFKGDGVFLSKSSISSLPNFQFYTGLMGSDIMYL
ncbi:hypothetical protein RJT34_29099 [Clitoria ternatea]|uniref:Uncharacterized protein n=1 Tax=Clitoria ternatea TaxID=43366 RepID=A0AAN9FC49_CLITE